MRFVRVERGVSNRVVGGAHAGIDAGVVHVVLLLLGKRVQAEARS